MNEDSGEELEREMLDECLDKCFARVDPECCLRESAFPRVCSLSFFPLTHIFTDSRMYYYVIHSIVRPLYSV